MELLIPVLLNCLLVIVVYLADKYTPARRLPHWAKQLLIGLLFGGMAIFASEYGIHLMGVVTNVRDAAPLSAGLIFGGPAGILSGLIGGLYRWFSVAWGASTYTQLACTVATIFVGFAAAGLRKLMFDNKKPTWGYGICIAVVCEVIHMLLIFVTNMTDSVQAFSYVRELSLPMILGNAFSVGLSILLVTLLSRERLHHKKEIAHTFQRWLLICLMLAFFATGTFTFLLQNNMADLQTQEIFNTSIADVYQDVRDKADASMLQVARQIARAYQKDPDFPLDQLAAEYHVAELNVVNADGFIVNTTVGGYLMFDMHQTEQSSAFLVLNEGQQTFTQEYGPVGGDSLSMRKYVGVALDGGGFLQVGYSPYQFHKLMDPFVVDVTKNRHVGSNGFVAVCDEGLRLVTDDLYDEVHISTIGIDPNQLMLDGQSTQTLCHTNIVNAITGKSSPYIYVFTFVEGYCIIAAMPEDDAMFMRNASLYTSMFMQILIFATLFVFIYFLIKKVIINNLRKVNASLAQITEGNLNVTVDVRANEEFASLSDDINSTVSTLKRYIAEAAARIDKELEYAKQIQLSVLPTNFPDQENYRINAQMIAAKEVGGDFYDFYKLDDTTAVFLVADVSGKGIPAAMFMMTAKTILKDLAERGMAVNEIFTTANEKLCENNESGMFVTAWMGILDLQTGQLEFANAGHNPPLLKRADGSFAYLRSRAGFVLAGMEGVRYRANQLQLQPGDRIFLYTDGVTEATNSAQQLYGEDRLLAFLEQHQTQDSLALLPQLKADIDHFVGDAPQFDDITMLLLDYCMEQSTAISRRFPAAVDALDSLLSFVEQTLEQYECPMKLQTGLCIAIEEVFVNVANYAYGEGTGEVDFSISLDSASRTVTFRMADRGVPFDPLQKRDPDITLSAEDRQIGGLGIFITKKTMDTVTYAYENGENVLTMTKTI